MSLNLSFKKKNKPRSTWSYIMLISIPVWIYCLAIPAPTPSTKDGTPELNCRQVLEVFTFLYQHDGKKSILFSFAKIRHSPRKSIFFSHACCCLIAKSCLTLLQPHGLQPARLLCSCDFSGKNTGVGCQFLLQGIFLNQGLELHLLHWQLDPLPLSQLGSPITNIIAVLICIFVFISEL